MPQYKFGAIKSKVKAVPLHAWSGPEGLQEVKAPRLHDNGTGFR